ncbi:MAG: hypothetical protein C4523_14235 [Myxococcales bacterium]|nr:MAG: hypothetical protein C4523_14235 [Myxococcales bacterium]
MLTVNSESRTIDKSEPDDFRRSQFDRREKAMAHAMTLEKACEEYALHASECESSRTEIGQHLKVFIKFVLDQGKGAGVGPHLSSALKEFLSSLDGMKKKNGEPYVDSWKAKSRRHVGGAVKWFEEKRWFAEEPPALVELKKPAKSGAQGKTVAARVETGKVAPPGEAAGRTTPPKSIKAESDALVETSSENQLTFAQRQIIGSAVKAINASFEKAVSAGFNAMVEVGRYLLKHNFHDDEKMVESHSPNKVISIRKLAKHPKILVSYSWLSRAIRLAVHEDEFASVAASRHLTPSHKLLLLNVDDPEERARYISLIVADDPQMTGKPKVMSVRELRKLLVEDEHIKAIGLAALDEERMRWTRLGLAPVIFPMDDLLGMSESGLDRYLHHVVEMTKDERINDVKDGIVAKMVKVKAHVEKLINHLNNVRTTRPSKN